jgi:hypothetical protein
MSDESASSFWASLVIHRMGSAEPVEHVGVRIKRSVLEEMATTLSHLLTRLDAVHELVPSPDDVFDGGRRLRQALRRRPQLHVQPGGESGSTESRSGRGDMAGASYGWNRQR